MKEKIDRAIALILVSLVAVLVIFGGLYVLLVNLFDGLSAPKVATIFLGFVAFIALIGGMNLFFVSRMWSIRQEPVKQQQAIDTTYSIVNPAMTAQRRAIPAPEMTQPIFDYDASGKRIEIDRDIAVTFLEKCWPDCSRAFWKGGNAGYSLAVDYFSRMPGQPLLKSGNGYEWAEWVTSANISNWLRGVRQVQA